jgi:xanthine dehydrogenase small subunit
MGTRFLANDRLVDTEAGRVSPALDFIRRDLGLTGTKEGCREGDCGACAVLVGHRTDEARRRPDETGRADYRALPSCLLALGELEGCHLVTIEGLASGGKPGKAGAYAKLTPVMAAIAEANGSQCGFCSPGFVVSLSAYLLNGDGPERKLSVEGAVRAIEGNLCRCTGYGSIKRAAAALVEKYSSLPARGPERLESLVEEGVLPPQCLAFARGELLPPRAAFLAAAAAAKAPARDSGAAILLGGGTDYFVRNPEGAPGGKALLASSLPELRRITREDADEGGRIAFGAALSWREFFASPELRQAAPGIERFEQRLASPLVRELATIGGNVANASPVGDVTSMLIALGAGLKLTRSDGSGAREAAIENFFLGYKKLDLGEGEIISAILLSSGPRIPGSSLKFNFEKASKRERLDIAAVNSAALFELDGESRIARARISAGGVAPVPRLLEKTSAFLIGKRIAQGEALEIARAAARMAAEEVSPISDIRGSADYRARVLERLVLAHFIELFPGAGVEEAIA